MTSDSGIPIEQPINTFNKEIKIKFKDFLPALGKAGVDAALLKMWFRKLGCGK